MLHKIAQHLTKKALNFSLCGTQEKYEVNPAKQASIGSVFSLGALWKKANRFQMGKR